LILWEFFNFPDCDALRRIPGWTLRVQRPSPGVNKEDKTTTTRKMIGDQVDKPILEYENKTFGIHPFKLNLAALYPDPAGYEKFLARFESFMESDPYNKKIFSLNEGTLTYSSETFVSTQEDPRPPLLLVLGNPASHSIAHGMCFAFEHAGKEHRFWKGLAAAGILTFQAPLITSEDPGIRNEARKQALREHRYDSPFRVGIAVFYSLPSASSNLRWSGVDGMKRLLGAKAFGLVSQEEKSRMDTLLRNTMKGPGGIIVFQKDAYNWMRSEGMPEYRRDLAVQGKLRGRYGSERSILLTCSPPTRLMQSIGCIEALRRYRDWMYEELS
jgi:hypothetical protein